MTHHIAISVSDITQVGEARRRMAQIAQDAGFNESDRGKAALLVTELATNLARYSTGGEILLCAIAAGGRKFLEILALDRGPGIADVSRSLQDGFSTGGTPGNGLGAVLRTASEFDIYSMQPGGTGVLARLEETRYDTSKASDFVWGVVCRPAAGETQCGDTWRIAERPGELAIMLVDGLGHGPDAAKAAEEAARVFDYDPFSPLPAIMDNAHIRMRSTRGGAVSIAQLNGAHRSLAYAGIGNIAGHLRSASMGGGRGLFSHNGTVGLQMRTAQTFNYECPSDALLVMHSDGLKSRWNLDPYPGISFRHPAILAGVLYRDFTRGRDDVTVAVVRLTQN